MAILTLPARIIAKTTSVLVAANSRARIGPGFTWPNRSRVNAECK